MDQLQATTITARTTNEEYDRAMRPKSLADFRGQRHVVELLRVCIAGALKRGEPMDHAVMTGPPGLGKTTLAEIVAAELGARIVTLHAPTLKTQGELCAALMGLEKGDVLFIDEIHSLDPKVAEVLYPAMEDFRLKVVAGNQLLDIDLNPFTLVGATTVIGKLERPLRDRFGIVCEMQPYDVLELSGIARSSAEKLGMIPADNACDEVARRSQGTPRIANRLLRRIRDFVDAAGQRTMTRDLVVVTCGALGVDSAGLDRASRGYLQILVDKGAPVGLSTLSAMTGESKSTLEEAVEPFLMRAGLIEKTLKGRVATAAGMAHLGVGSA